MYIPLFDTKEPNKNDGLKKNFIDFFIRHGSSTIADIARESDLSIPTVTKILTEMQQEGLLVECGKSENSGTRKATLFNINADLCYFMGIDIRQSSILVAITDFSGKILFSKECLGYKISVNTEGLPAAFDIIDRVFAEIPVEKEKIVRLGIALPGKIDIVQGISNSYLYQDGVVLADLFEERYGIPTRIDNDTRAMCYGEYMCGIGNGEQDVVYVNMSWGLGMSLITEGRLYYGKSGFSGEWGHVNAFDNEILCYCGKKGCLETEVSGRAVHRQLIEKYKKGCSTILSDKIDSGDRLTLEDILDAIKKDDILSIELVESAGRILGKHIAGLLNIFNPELIILGGTVGAIGDYLAFPVKTGIMKYTLNYVNNDTELKVAMLGRQAGAIGSCMLVRSKCLGVIPF
ncbi:MAG: ROK family transcriptional regulator [Bacteroidales bacterium]